MSPFVPHPTQVQIQCAEKSQATRLAASQKNRAAVRRDNKIIKRLKKRCHRVKTMKISAKILRSAVPRKKKNPLVDLPAEITSMVFKALPNVDRFCLALTCKDLASSYEMLKGEKNKSDYDHKVAKATEYTRLEILIRLKPDMPARLRLCYNCNQYIDLDNPDNTGTWGGSASRVDGHKVDKVTMVHGPRCPLCAEADQALLAQHKETYRAYLALGN